MSEAGDEVSEFGRESTDHQTSYIFTAPTAGDTSGTQRPVKRRRISRSNPVPDKDAVSEHAAYAFPALLNGLESQRCVNLRQQLFHKSWKNAEGKIQKIVQHANQATLDEVAHFIQQPLSTGYEHQLPTGLIVTGPNIASQDLLFSQITGHLRSDSDAIAVAIRSGDAPNLKTALKKIIRDATDQSWDEDDDLAHSRSERSGISHEKRGRKLLNYDLEILHRFMRVKQSGKVIIAFQDSEAFDITLLSELLKLLSSWLDRIPFVILLGIATSVELFHERLPRQVIRLMHGVQFGVEQTSKTLEKILNEVVADDRATIFLGSNFIGSLLARQNEHVQSLQTFVMSLKYAYMCHFYANPLSIFAIDAKHSSGVLSMLQPEHFEAIRMLESFQTYIQSLIESGDLTIAKALLESDDDLQNALTGILWQDRSQDVDKDGSLPMSLPRSLRRHAIVDNLHHLYYLNQVAQCSGTDEKDFMDMYLKAFDGTLDGSDMIRDTLEAFKHFNGEELASATSILLDSIRSEHRNLSKEEQAWFEELNNLYIRIENEFDVSSKSKYLLERSQTKSLRTTVVAQRVHLSEQQISLSSTELSEAEGYTNVIDTLVETIKPYLTFTNPKEVPFHEIFVFDFKTPNRQVFAPRPRQAVEQALMLPHSYLDCDCCDPFEETLSHTNPHTAILYQLYLETGALINVHDLWSAFYAIISGEGGQDCEERMGLALFYRALADLKLLGMVKQSRKKVDHLGKMTWKGL